MKKLENYFQNNIFHGFKWEIISRKIAHVSTNVSYEK